jgi:hypothetical protein
VLFWLSLHVVGVVFVRISVFFSVCIVCLLVIMNFVPIGVLWNLIFWYLFICFIFCGILLLYYAVY